MSPKAEHNQGNGSSNHGNGSLHSLPTGVSNLDRLLRGGVPLYAMSIIAGAPGTGKTILAQQILFDVARRGQRGLYLTTVSESPMKAARYQQNFDFFDPEMFGEQVVYLDIGQVIRAQGLSTALATIADALRRVQPAVVVIDSFKAIHDLAPSASDMRTFVFDLAIELTAVRATTFLVGEYAPDDLTIRPEMAVADGIIWLSTEVRNNRLSRKMQIMKMRGVDHDTAQHTFDISRRGIDLYALNGVEPHVPPGTMGQVAPTGIVELDNLLKGGIPRGSPTLLSGEAGTGKTTLGMQFLYNGATRYDEKGIYFSFEESPEQLIADAKAFGWDFQPLIEAGKVQIEYTPLTHVEAPQQIVFIHEVVRETGAKRVVVDSLSVLMARVGDGELIRGYLFQLITGLKNMGCTALITSDPMPGSGGISRFGVEESILDGVIVLKVRPEKRGRTRYLEVYKLRGVGHGIGDNTMRITSHGIEVVPRIEETRS